MKTLLVISFFLGACQVRDPAIPAPNPPPDTDLVGEMCLHLQELHCEEGDAVYNDNLPGPVDEPNQSCEDFHKELQDQGVFVNPRCVSKVPDCDQIEDYRTRKPETC